MKEAVAEGKENIQTFDFTSNALGKRAKNIILASEKVSKILSEESKELYFKLRIEV